MVRWPGGARWRIRIAFRIRFRSKELFAQGKLFLGGVWYILLTGFWKSFLGILCTNLKILVHFRTANTFLGYFGKSR